MYLNEHILDSNNFSSKTLYVVEDTTLKNVNINISPQSYKLEQNYPNPFNPLTTIAYRVPNLDKLKISIYNMRV